MCSKQEQIKSGRHSWHIMDEEYVDIVQTFFFSSKLYVMYGGECFKLCFSQFVINWVSLKRTVRVT